jgi:hypothetical protein
MPLDDASVDQRQLTGTDSCAIVALSANRTRRACVAEYLSILRDVASTHLDEIEADLAEARRELEHFRGQVKQQEARVEALVALAELASSSNSEVPVPAKLKLHDAMAEVLRTAPEHMMRAGDLAAEIQRRRLYRMRDGRPVEAQQIHARVGHYADRFERVGTFIKLRD